MRKESESENRVQLTMAKQQGTLIEVHNLPNDDYFNVGFVVALDPVFCLMISIDWDGKINGLIAIRIKSILYTERHSDYLMTVSEKTKVAHDHNYFDIWQVQKFIDNHPDITQGNLLSNLTIMTMTYLHYGNMIFCELRLITSAFVGLKWQPGNRFLMIFLMKCDCNMS